MPTVLSRCFIKRGVGIGSRQQVFKGDEIMMDLTSSSVTHLKSDKHSPHVLHQVERGVFPNTLSSGLTSGTTLPHTFPRSQEIPVPSSLSLSIHHLVGRHRDVLVTDLQYGTPHALIKTSMPTTLLTAKTLNFIPCPKRATALSPLKSQIQGRTSFVFVFNSDRKK